LVPDAVAELPEPEFSNSQLRAAGKLLWSQPGIAVLSLKDDQSEEFRLGESLLSRFAMQSGEKFPNPVRHLQDLLRRMQRIQLEDKSRRIQKALDSRPGGVEETRLLAQKSELNVAIQHLKQAQQ
jgi:hypothetical protein